MKSKALIVCIALSWAGAVDAEDISLCLKGWQATEMDYFDKAEKLYQRCINEGKLSEPTLSRTYRNLGLTYLKSEQFEKAVTSFTKALSLNPNDPWDDYVNRARAWTGLNDTEKALADFDQALATNPDYNVAFFNRGLLFEKLGKNDKAIAEFHRAFEHGLRSKALHQRFVEHGLLPPLR